MAVASFFLIATWTWAGFDDDPLAQLAGTSAIALVATLLGTTQLVLHCGEHTWVVLVTWASLLLASLLTCTGIWQESSNDGLWKAAGSCWIVGVMGWLLLPVLQRFTAAALPVGERRVLATLDDVELVATRSPEGIEFQLKPGERLALRRRSPAAG